LRAASPDFSVRFGSVAVYISPVPFGGMCDRLAGGRSVARTLAGESLQGDSPGRPHAGRDRRHLSRLGVELVSRPQDAGGVSADDLPLSARRHRAPGAEQAGAAVQTPVCEDLW